MNFREQMNAIFDLYAAEVSPEPTTLEVVADWAVARGLYQPNLRTVAQMCRDDLADSLRQDRRIDRKGRSYRAKISVRESIGGVQTSLWSDADLAPRMFVQKSAMQRRRAIAHDCFQLKQDVDHFNDERGGDDPLPLPLDFTEDVAELEAEARMPRGKAA